MNYTGLVGIIDSSYPLFGYLENSRENAYKKNLRKIQEKEKK